MTPPPPPGVPAGAPPRARRPLRFALWVLAAVAVAAYGVRFCALGNDFLAFYDAGAQALRRGDIYAPSAHNGMYVFYAPHFSLLMMPFAALPEFVAGFLWFALKVAALAWVVREAWGEIRATAQGLPRSRVWPAYLALPLVLLGGPIAVEMKLGQVNLFVFTLTLLALRAMEAGRPWRAAALFSVALVKVTPWVFVPWFVFRRQWKLLGALTAAGASWLAALAVWFGPDRVVEILRSWVATSRLHKLGMAEVAYFQNQSLQGVSARIATVVPALTEPVLGIPLYRVLWIAPALALFAVTLASAARDRFRPALPRAEFAFMCLAMYLCSPDSRWAHQMQLIAPVALLAALAARLDALALRPAAPGPAPGGWRRGVVAVVALGFLFQVVLTRDVVGKRLDNAARWWSTPFLFTVALTVLVAALLLRRRPAAVNAGSAAAADPLAIRAAFPLAPGDVAVPVPAAAPRRLRRG
jgi:hypothetical protein